jgi:ethylmalonyl-CoA mutase
VPERYGVTDPKLRRFRYGVQVNSLGLTEAQPENNIARILIEMLAVTMSKDARARAVQLPAWNEALGLPRPWDQQLSLRMQQILAFETDLLEHGDLFNGSHVMDALTDDITGAAKDEYRKVLDMGGAVEAVDYMKGELVRSNAERIRRIESGEQVVVGVNKFTETEPSPLVSGVDAGFLKVDQAPARPSRSSGSRRSAPRGTQAAVTRALDDAARAAESGENVMPASIAAARPASRPASGPRRCATCSASTGARRASRPRPGPRRHRGPRRGRARSPRRGAPRRQGPHARREARPRRPLLGCRADRRPRPRRRLRGHLRGHPPHPRPDRPRRRRRGRPRRRPVDPVRLARAAHPAGPRRPAREGMDVPVVVGGIIPPADAEALRAAGVAAVYTPKDYQVSEIIGEIADLVARASSTSRAGRWWSARTSAPPGGATASSGASPSRASST